MHVYSHNILLRCFMFSALLATILFAAYKQLHADMRINYESPEKLNFEAIRADTLLSQSADTDIDVDDFRFQISDTGGWAPSVAYNFTDNEYIIVWNSVINADGQLEIIGQRLDATMLEKLGNNDFHISSDIGDGDQEGNRRFFSAVSYNSTNNEYLVVWVAKDIGNEEFEIFGQRLDATTGEELGDNDFRISDIGSSDEDMQFIDPSPSIAYNSKNNEYLVVWTGDNIKGEFEIYGQRIDGVTGEEIGMDDFRISDIGRRRILGRSFSAALNPSVTYNSTNNEYLVVWSGDEKRRRLLLPLTPISLPIVEIFGQRIDGLTGSEVGENDFPISKVNGKAIASVLIPYVSYNFQNNEYLVVWDGADVGFGGGLSTRSGSSFEKRFNSAGIFGQRIDGTTGNALRPNFFRINSSGDGLIKPAIAYNSQENEYMVIWRREKQEILTDDNGSMGIHIDQALFGQRINGATSETREAEDFKLANDLRGTIASVAYNTKENEYLIVWASRTNTEGIEISDQTTEIFGRRFRP